MILGQVVDLIGLMAKMNIESNYLFLDHPAYMERTFFMGIFVVIAEVQ